MSGKNPETHAPQDLGIFSVFYFVFQYHSEIFLVAIFHASFHPTQGNVVDWSLKASDGTSQIYR
jgi:hypothetical protein